MISGSKDIIVPTESTIKLAETIPGAELKIVPGAGHLLFIEQADEFNEASLRFLEPLRKEVLENEDAPSEPGFFEKILSALNPFGHNKNGLKKPPYKIKKGF